MNRALWIDWKTSPLRECPVGFSCHRIFAAQIEFIELDVWIDLHINIHKIFLSFSISEIYFNVPDKSILDSGISLILSGFKFKNNLTSRRGSKRSARRHDLNESHLTKLLFLNFSRDFLYQLRLPNARTYPSFAEKEILRLNLPAKNA